MLKGAVPWDIILKGVRYNNEKRVNWAGIRYNNEMV
jgi:hypothetical protein